MAEWWSWVGNRKIETRLRAEQAELEREARELLGIANPIELVDSADALADLLLSLGEDAKSAADRTLWRLAEMVDARARNSRKGSSTARDFPMTHLVALGAGRPSRADPWHGIAGIRSFPLSVPPHLAEVFGARPQNVREAWLKRLGEYTEEGAEWEILRALETAGMADPTHDRAYWRAAWNSLVPASWALEEAGSAGRARLAADPELARELAAALEDPPVADVLTMFFGQRMIDEFAAWARDGLLPLDDLCRAAIRGIANGPRPGTAGGLRRLATAAGVSDQLAIQETDALLRVASHARPTEQKWAIDLLARAAKAGAIVPADRATAALSSAVEAGTAASAKAAFTAMRVLDIDTVTVAAAALANPAAAVQELGIAALEASTPLGAEARADIGASRQGLEPRIRNRLDALLGTAPAAADRTPVSASGTATVSAAPPSPPPLATADDVIDAFLLWREDPGEAVHATAVAAAVAATVGTDASASHRTRLDRAVKHHLEDPWNRPVLGGVAAVLAAWAGLDAAPPWPLAVLAADHAPADTPLIRGDCSAGTALLVTLIAEAAERSRSAIREGGAAHALVVDAAAQRAPRITGWAFTPPRERYAGVGVSVTLDGPAFGRRRPPCTDLTAVVAAWGRGPLSFAAVWMEDRGLLDLEDGDTARWILATFPSYADVLGGEAAVGLLTDSTQERRTRVEHLVVETLGHGGGPHGLGAAALIAAAATCSLAAPRAALVDALLARGDHLPLEAAGRILADAVAAGHGGLSRVAGIVRDCAAAGGAETVLTLVEAAAPGLPRNHRDLSVVLEAWEVACDAVGAGVSTEAARAALAEVSSGGGKRAASAKRLLALEPR